MHVFDHLVWERYHYQDVVEVRKYGETGILFKVVNPSKKDLDDVELIFDFNDKKIRASHYKVCCSVIPQHALCITQSDRSSLPHTVSRCISVSQQHGHTRVVVRIDVYRA